MDMEAAHVDLLAIKQWQLAAHCEMKFRTNARWMTVASAPADAEVVGLFLATVRTNPPCVRVL